MSIERLASGGDGVGRLADGRTVFVPFAAPGDTLRVRVVERKPRLARAEIESIEHPGSARRAAPCAAYGSCGGCSWQHLDYAAQLEAKRGILCDALERIGRFRLPGALKVHASPSEFGYRTRARVLAVSGRVGFRRVHSHELEPIEACPVLAPELEAALGEAAQLGQAHGRPAEIELSLGGDGATRVTLSADSGGMRPDRPDPSIGESASDGLDLAVLGNPLRISPGVFAQANGALIEPLVRAATLAAGRGARVAELFAGAGLFTLTLAERFERVLAVEANRLATADLAFNLERAGRSAGVEILTRPVERALEPIARFAPDVLVLDPPRSGLERISRERLGHVRAERIVYVSCDPATLARDLRALCDSGYGLEHVEGFDLFPQTHHIEAVAVLVAARPALR